MLIHHKYIEVLKLKYVKCSNVKYENNNAKDSTMFFNYIRNVRIYYDEIMVSFDIFSLYTNIPIIDMVNIIKYYANNDDQFTRKKTIPQDKFFWLSL